MSKYEVILGCEVSTSAMSNLKENPELLVQALLDGKIENFDLTQGGTVTVAMSAAAKEWLKENQQVIPKAPVEPKPVKPQIPIVTSDEMASVRFTGCTPSDVVKRFIIHDVLNAPNLPLGPLHVSIWRNAGPERVAYLLEGVGERFVNTDGAQAAERAEKAAAQAEAMRELENERRGKTAAHMRKVAEQKTKRMASQRIAEARAKASRLIRGGFPEAGKRVLKEAGLGS